MMSNNHIHQGLMFVAATALIGAGAFVFTQLSSEGDSSGNAACAESEVSIDMSAIAAQGGAVEILSPLDNTGAFSRNIFPVVDGISCVPSDTLATMLSDAGEKAGSIQLELTYDPAGTVSGVRSRLEYMPDEISGDIGWSEPPAELKFGSGFWSARSQPTEIQIRWLTKAQLSKLVGVESSDYAISDQVAPPPPQATYQDCMDNSGGVTVTMLDCAASELDIQDARLNAAYQQKMRELDSPGKSSLRTLQRAWIKQRDQGCTAKAAPEEGGTLAEVIYSTCLVTETTERVDRLNDY